MSHLNTSLEPDFESFLNVDNDFTPASATATPHPSVPTLAHQNSSISSFGASSQQQTFSAPSFQYDAYRQQTGLPVGGLANTFAVNQSSGLNHFDGHSSFVMPNEISNFPLTKLEDFDFGRNPSFDMTDMDFEEESPSDIPAMFFPGGSSKGFVSPTNLVASNTSPSTSTPVQRMYPGMHSQQAAQKAHQAQQKQQELIRQQQEQQQRQIPGQKPLPKGQPAKDPAVEESISRILSQMRQKREADLDDEDGTPGPSTSMSRSRKEEDDMDEDERLLASEEGKKLTSKERRQLRNKVSARAFRSRRKEYIGQLEGDVAAKADEANALRVENQQLREENNRLTDLTRMLLSSSAFSSFLQELSQSGVPTNPNQQQILQNARPDRLQAQPTRKDVNPHEAARQMQPSQQQQVGMVLMPDSHFDMSLFDTPTWAPAAPSNDVSIFSVTSLPEGPVLDLEKLSDKDVSVSKTKAKVLPSLPELPEAVQAASAGSVDFVPTCAASTPEPGSDMALKTTLTDDLKAPFVPSSISTEAAVDGSKSWQSLRAMCGELEGTSNRLRGMIPRMG